MAERSAAQTTNPGVAREPRDASIAAFALLGGIVAGSVLIVIVGLLLAFPSARDDQPKAPASAPPAPRLQVRPADDLATYRAAMQARLSSYGWSDRAAGLARVPIEEAMRRVAAEGIADWPAGAPR